MSDKIALDLKKTAVLIMDYQKAIIERMSINTESFLVRAAQVLDKARQANLPVIYVVVNFREGHPEIGLSSRNATFGNAKKMNLFSPSDLNGGIHESVKPQKSDIIVTKKRISAFAGSDLDLILRSNGIDTLVMFGFSTSGVVLSTTRYAADLDYHCILIEDLCADRDSAVHDMLMSKVLKAQAQIVSSEDFIASLS